ncbi:STE3-domain-containing protein [Russula ochroleuca]|uniref:STE3-domain-containing protein n=1 Tax=Russula ochroleuca TaxID=152965 RepID=A0A9P5JYC7_9AGAM|nr:STE3-domain-containing protein [Russula ochroleuca]
MSLPNELYSAFSFIGFVLCVIPFYWHLEAWNTGTCLYMFWAGLGCLIQFINSIIWNGNMINRAPIYCLISTHIQVAQNVAIPACSLCINRRLYKIAKAKAAMTTNADRRRAVIQDLLIGVGLPILQIIAGYVVSSHRYNIFEDFGPASAFADTPLTFILLYSWPVVVGTASLFYCVTSIYTFYKRQRQFRQIMVHSQGLNRSRYFRLMALSATEILGTIPLGTYFIVSNAKGVRPWESWAEMHRHYSKVIQVPSIVWENDPYLAGGLGVFRWSMVASAFVFFAFFGFADEARQHYRRVYTSIASRIGYSTSTLHGSSDATSPVPYVKSGVTVTVVRTTRSKRSSSVSTDQPSTLSISSGIASDINPELKIEQYSPSNTVTSSSVESFDELRMQGQPTMPAGVIMPTVPPASVPPHFPDRIESTMRAYSGVDTV